MPYEHEVQLAPGDRQAIEEAARLLRQRFPVSDVVLFGSKARGDDDEESDIDLLVLTTRQLHWRERGRLCDALYELGLDLGVVYGPLVQSREEWRSDLGRALPIHAEIEREGVAL